MTPADLETLIWLAAREVVFFSAYDPREDPDFRGWSCAILCNDSFVYASADAEDFDPAEADEVRGLYERHGWAGPLAWVARKRGVEPLEPLRTDAYRAARAELEA